MSFSFFSFFEIIIPTLRINPDTTAGHHNQGLFGNLVGLIDYFGLIRFTGEIVNTGDATVDG